MTCQDCGHPNISDARFCAKCGTGLPEDSKKKDTINALSDAQSTREGKDCAKAERPTETPMPWRVTLLVSGYAFALFALADWFSSYSLGKMSYTFMISEIGLALAYLSGPLISYLAARGLKRRPILWCVGTIFLPGLLQFIQSSQRRRDFLVPMTAIAVSVLIVSSVAIAMGSFSDKMERLWTPNYPQLSKIPSNKEISSKPCIRGKAVLFLNRSGRGMEHLPSGLRAERPGEIKTVILVETGSEKVGSYGSGYYVGIASYASVRIIDKERDVLVAEENFAISPPSQINIDSSGKRADTMNPYDSVSPFVKNINEASSKAFSWILALERK